MNHQSIIVALSMTLLPLSTHATERLSCQVQHHHIQGTRSKPTVTDFTWSTAHNTAKTTGAVRTSLGRIEESDDGIKLNGKEIALPSAVQGAIYFGKVYDYGNKVAMVYLVSRADDSIATPSEVVILLSKGDSITGFEVMPGTEMSSPDQCSLFGLDQNK